MDKLNSLSGKVDITKSFSIKKVGKKKSLGLELDEDEIIDEQDEIRIMGEMVSERTSKNEKSQNQIQ